MAPSFREIFADFPDIRLVAPGAPGEYDGFSVTDAPPEAADAPLVEDGPFAPKPCRFAETSGLTHFLDGAQRSWRVLYEGLAPVYLTHTSAALATRQDRHLVELADSGYDGGFSVVGPAGGAAETRLKPLFEYIGVSVAIGETDIAIQLKIRDLIDRRRTARESALGANFAGGCLLVDGGIGELLATNPPGAPIVGLVKSHQRQYFRSAERIQAILALRPGERTTAFLRDDSKLQGKACYSFYLKLLEAPYTGPMFGLVRVEVPAQPEWMARFDEIAEWIIAERTPRSQPDPRYDRLLYPIHLVEMHLKARQPSAASIRGLLGI